MSLLYEHPEEYDLEYLGDHENIGFYVSSVRKCRPSRVLELGCGTGRITLPVATRVELGFDVVGFDSQPDMLEKAKERVRQALSNVRERLTLIKGDMRKWSADRKTRSPRHSVLVDFACVGLG